MPMKHIVIPPPIKMVREDGTPSMLADGTQEELPFYLWCRRVPFKDIRWQANLETLEALRELMGKITEKSQPGDVVSMADQPDWQTFSAAAKTPSIAGPDGKPVSGHHLFFPGWLAVQYIDFIHVITKASDKPPVTALPAPAPIVAPEVPA